MSVYQLPMLECSSCGRYVGTLYNDYYDLSAKLVKDLGSGTNPKEQYSCENGDDITEYVQTYYKWYNENKPHALEYTPVQIIARALLRTKELDPEDLPYGSLRNPDKQMSMHEAKMCCLRMLLTDPTGTE